MANIYYSRRLADGTARPPVGPFRNVQAARRAIGQAMLDNGYERTPRNVGPYVDLFTWSDPGPHTHTPSGMVYMVHSGDVTPAALAEDRPPVTL